MSHELSTNAAGMVEFAYCGDKAWHGLGQELDQNASIETWKKEAGFDWNINEAPVQFTAPDGSLLTMNDKRVLSRSDTNAPLSVVGDDYKVVQPGEVLEFFRDLVDGTGMYLETAGVLFGGRRFWAMANMGKSAYIGKKEDTIKGYLMFATSADTSMASVAQMQSTRTVCSNTMRIALAENTKSRVRVTHRSVFDPDMVKRRLGLYEESWDKFIEDSNKLASKVITDNEAKVIIDSLILTKPDDEEKSSTQSRNQADFILNLYKGAGMGADMAYGTAWGVLNAITETTTHHSKNRTADSKLWNQFFGAGDKLNQEAFSTLLAMV